MRKLFLKYFFSILAITVVSLFVQNGLLLLQYSQSQNKWKDFVYYDFVDSVEKALSESTFPDYSLDTKTLFGNALESDSRISGFLVRDQAGRISFTVGQSSEGLILSSVAPINMLPEERGKEVTIKGHNTVLNIVYNGSEFEIIKKTDSEKNTTYKIPQGINANDVIGSVIIMFDSKPLSSIDILSFSPRTYKYSKDIINSCWKSITIAVPICLVIALVFSYIISSKNAKYIDSIRKALNDLADGKNNIKLKNNKNSELNEITVAVSELDKTLQANKKSRLAWLTSISHDLNTPATAMKMIVDGLNDGVFKANKTTLAELQTENDILCDRINRVIEFSSLQADVKPVFETVSSSDIISSLSNEFPHVNFEAKVAEIKCDKVLICKAVRELLKNACSASTDNNISFCIQKVDNSFVLSVSNSGSLPKGFTASQFFEPWAKGDFSRSTVGNGLGLAIVHSIANLHNGEAVLSEDSGLVTASIKWTL